MKLNLKYTNSTNRKRKWSSRSVLKHILKSWISFPSSFANSWGSEKREKVFKEEGGGSQRAANIQGMLWIVHHLGSIRWKGGWEGSIKDWSETELQWAAFSSNSPWRFAFSLFGSLWMWIVPMLSSSDDVFSKHKPTKTWKVLSHLLLSNVNASWCKYFFSQFNLVAYFVYIIIHLLQSIDTNICPFIQTFNICRCSDFTQFWFASLSSDPITWK